MSVNIVRPTRRSAASLLATAFSYCSGVCAQIADLYCDLDMYVGECSAQN